jgi:plasmid replication initiation protein
MENRILMKNNNIVGSKYDAKLVHNRIFTYLLYAFQKNTDAENLVHEVNRSELSRFVLRKNENTLKGLMSILEELRCKKLNLANIKEDGSRDYIIAGFINKAVYNDRSDSFTITADAEVHRLLNKYLEDGYTPVNLEIFMSLKNTYAQRFYDLLRMWSGTKNVINYKLDYIRKILLLENKYSEYNNFKRRVLVPAIEELNDTGYFEITFEEKRAGRSIDSINFMVNDKDKRKYFDNLNMIKKDNKIIKEETTKNIIKEDLAVIKDNTNDFYVPNKKLFTTKTLANFISDFSNYDFKEKENKKALQESILTTLEKDDEEKIKVNSYNYFKKTLENKINSKDNKNEKTIPTVKTRFHNINQTFNKYNPEELEKILLESQKDKFK